VAARSAEGEVGVRVNYLSAAFGGSSPQHRRAKNGGTRTEDKIGASMAKGKNRALSLRKTLIRAYRFPCLASARRGGGAER